MRKSKSTASELLGEFIRIMFYPYNDKVRSPPYCLTYRISIRAKRYCTHDGITLYIILLNNLTK